MLTPVKRTSPLLAAAAVMLAACTVPAAPGSVVVVAARDPGPAPQPVEAAPQPAGDPAPRPGRARRFLRLPGLEPAAVPVRAAIEVPAGWGIRVREGAGRALRPCQVSPSSPGELFVAARQKGAPVAEHEQLAADLISAQLVVHGEIEAQGTEPRGPDASLARLSGHRGGHVFYAFRFVRAGVEGRAQAACEAFLFEDEVRWREAYEAACATLRLDPEEWQDGPDELPAAPDGEPRPPADEGVAQAALGYVSALGARDEKAAATFLLTAPECIAAGGAPDQCESGAVERRADIPLIIDRIPFESTFGTADVRAPGALPGLVIATVKRRGDPCGPGWDVTLARAEGRHAVVSADPVPDPRLLR